MSESLSSSFKVRTDALGKPAVSVEAAFLGHITGKIVLSLPK